MEKNEKTNAEQVKMKDNIVIEVLKRQQPEINSEHFFFYFFKVHLKHRDYMWKGFSFS